MYVVLKQSPKEEKIYKLTCNMPFFWRSFNVVCCLNNSDIQILNQNQKDNTIHQEMRIFKIINLAKIISYADLKFTVDLG